VLSRIAESLFWIGRYIERAEDTARILDVHTQLLVEDPAIDPQAAGLDLLAAMGARQDPPIGPTTIMSRLCHDPLSSSSIVAAVRGVRESAQRARETVSIEMWEGINTTWHSVREGQLAGMRPQSAFRFVRERCAVISGIADSTMSHDEGWLFVVLGRTIERVDMTARMIRSGRSASSSTAWSNVLRACGAHHEFTRTYGGHPSDREAAEFILLDRLFPRSVVYTLTEAERAALDLEVGQRRSGFDMDASRQLGRARAELEFRPLDETLSDLNARMYALQQTCSLATDAISIRYFEGAAPEEWKGGAS